MKKDATNLHVPSIHRRDFIRFSAASATGAGLLTTASISAAGKSATLAEGPCQYPTASSILALFSTRVWQLPNKLKDSSDAINRENEIYDLFEVAFNELVKLVEKLTIRCRAVTRNDPRIRELTELANDAISKVRGLNDGSPKEEKIAYMNVVALLAAGEQMTRTAGGVADDYLPDDSETICKMIEKIKQMEVIKVRLDNARKTSQMIFADFVDTIGSINSKIVDASQAAALYEQGKPTEKTRAIVIIEEAQSQILALERQSTTVQDGSITTHELRMLLDVPKAMLENRIPTVTSLREDESRNLFQNASYDRASIAADAAYAQVRQIIIRYILPSDLWTVRLLALAVVGILRLYGANPPRTRLVRNALQSVPWVSGNSNIPAATSELVKIVI